MTRLRLIAAPHPEVTSLEIVHASTPLRVPRTVQQPGKLCNRARKRGKLCSIAINLLQTNTANKKLQTPVIVRNPAAGH